MTVPAENCEVKLHALRKTQDGVVVSFVIHPQQVPEGLMLADLGTRYMMAVAEIGHDEEPVKKPEWKSKPLSSRAGILCNDKAFQDWLVTTGRVLALDDEVRAEQAAGWLRTYCAVNSRAEISPGTLAGKHYLEIEADFYAASGRFPEER